MSIIRSQATPPRRSKHISRLFVPYQSFVGAFFGDSYRLLRLKESVPHADVFLVSHLENPTTILGAHAYTLEGLCPQLRQSRKRYIKRHLVDVLDQIYQNGQFDLNCPHSSLDRANLLSRQLEDALREARPQRYSFLPFFEFQEDGKGLEQHECLENLRNWDKVDFRYRYLLSKNGELQPYREAIARIYQEYGSLSHLRQIEYFRQSRWKSFLKSVASASPKMAGLMDHPCTRSA